MKGVCVYGAILLLSLALFWLAPAIDLYVSGLFYDPQHGFTLAAWGPLVKLEGLARWITGAILVVVAAGGLWLRVVGRPLWRLDRNALIFLAAAPFARASAASDRSCAACPAGSDRAGSDAGVAVPPACDKAC